MSANANNVIQLDAKNHDKTSATLKAKSLEAPRYGCAFGGAYAAVANLKKAIPVAHAGGGCVFQQFIGTNFGAGNQGIGYAGGNQTPSCNLTESEVVFGGEERLREQLGATLELMEGDIYFVLGACIPAMIGDDVDSIVKEFNEKSRAPIVYVNVPGFAGNSYYGYEAFFKAVIHQLLEKPVEGTKGLVNVIGFVPSLNPYWKGINKEIKRIFSKLGLKANLIFGHDGGIESLKELASAELTLVLSPWVGVESAKLLKEKFDVPYLVYPNIPVGPQATTEFVKELGKALSLDDELVTKVINEEEAEAYWLLDLAGDAVGMLSPSLTFGVVADSATAIGITQFLVNEGGFYPSVVILTDNPPEEYRQVIEDQLYNLKYGLKPEVLYEEDSYHIHKILDKHHIGLLLASSIEKHYSGIEPKVHHLSVSFPIHDRLLFDRAFAGYPGGGSLLEDIFSQFIMPF